MTIGRVGSPFSLRNSEHSLPHYEAYTLTSRVFHRGHCPCYPRPLGPATLAHLDITGAVSVSDTFHTRARDPVLARTSGWCWMPLEEGLFERE